MSSLLKSILLVFEEIFQFVFPLSADEQHIKHLTPAQFLEKLSIRTQHGVVVLAHFKDPTVRAAIHLVKFHRQKHAVGLVSTLLAKWFATHDQPNAVLVPMPLSKQRERERGFNQSAIIATAAIVHAPGYTVDTTILTRSRHTAPQTSLARRERLKNLENAFAVTPNIPNLHNKHIILIDDVVTTGATLQAAKAALLPLKPASVTCVALAG